MKKTFSIKSFVLGVVVTFFTTTTVVPAVAATIEAVFNNVNIAVNGQQTFSAGQNYTLENGSQVPYSIVYEGTTYLPLRKIGELFEKEIAWDNATRTVDIKDTVANTAPTTSTQPSAQTQTPATETRPVTPTTPATETRPATPDVEQTARQISYYSDCPTVPDFGKFTGATLTHEAKIALSYERFYDISTFSNDSFESYLQLLLDESFTFLELPANSEGNEVLYFLRYDNKESVTLEMQGGEMRVVTEVL